MALLASSSRLLTFVVFFTAASGQTALTAEKQPTLTERAEQWAAEVGRSQANTDGTIGIDGEGQQLFAQVPPRADQPA
jgi:hypothetical protein